MDFRIVREEDLEAVKWLWAYCFESHEPFFSWYFANYYRIENTLGGYEQGKLLSCLQLIPYQIFLRGQVLPTSYIVGLATYPEARRSGIIRGLLQSALEVMRERGHYINILMPFQAGFYYPFQWELCYHHYKYLISLTDLRDVSESWGDLSLVQSRTEINQLQQVYEMFMQDKHGYIVRQEMNWRYLLEEIWGEKGHIYLLKDKGEPQGYIIYILRNDRIIVREMIYSNLQAQKALFQFLYNHRSQVAMVEWNAPLDDLTYFSLPEAKRDIRIFPFLAGRIVDVVKALEAVNYRKGLKERITLQLEDELAFWNNGTFSLDVWGGKGRIEQIKGPLGDIICSIGAFSQLFFGRLSARELEKMGQIRVTCAEKIEILEQLFPKCNNYINEYF